jgi:hypothetical protein
MLMMRMSARETVMTTAGVMSLQYVTRIAAAEHSEAMAIV